MQQDWLQLRNLLQTFDTFLKDLSGSGTDRFRWVIVMRNQEALLRGDQIKLEQRLRVLVSLELRVNPLCAELYFIKIIIIYLEITITFVFSGISVFIFESVLYGCCVCNHSLLWDKVEHEFNEIVDRVLANV